MKATLFSAEHDLASELLQHEVMQTHKAARELRENQKSSPVPRAKRILLADDDPGVREMLGRVLESEHYEVMYAKTGQTAGAKFLVGSPDLVLLDLNMPDKDGWEAFGLMCEKNPMIPVIVITARPGQYEQAVEVGVDALMEKPLNLPILLETIRNLLAESESDRARRLTNPGFKTAFLSRETHAPYERMN